MEAILYICHGSRVPAAQQQAIAFIEKTMKESPAPINEYCFLELAKPTIEEAFRRCIEKGATKIAAVPVLLLTAVHAKKDIPNELNRTAAQFPEVQLNYGRPIGVHPGMVEILLERLKETDEALTEDSMIVLIGRGSTDPDVKRDLGEIAELLKQSSGVRRVDTCYLTAAEPGLEEGLKIAAESPFSKVFVIPYLLFTGILMKTIEKAINNHSQKDYKQYILSNYLGYHPHIESILRERAHELLGGQEQKGNELLRYIYSRR
ncbi:sirohydrochlorin chelatase [Bacillus sp. V3-13]|uniref:sirohydrochlorin chelatase n=1 Tax=Bacillus sp. V3-13 TaxID=2053728 RepID=UPI000C7730A6|nr:sirohydrochlorin chelatase [Bacillus sp. V3-13]PLR77888.1 sirohydrochlorin chelatase [Bacillus sp. V3-13]